MANPDLSVFGNIRTVGDFQRLNDEFEMKKQLAALKLQQSANGTDLPAPLQLANEYQKRIAMGDQAGADMITQFAKIYDKGVLPPAATGTPSATPASTLSLTNQPIPQAPMSSPESNAAVLDLYGEGNSTGANGAPAPTMQFALNSAPAPGARTIPGYAGAVSSISGAKAGAEEQAKKDVQLTMNPQIASAEERAKPAAKALGEADAELNERIARQPQLNKAVQGLSALGQIATYTGTGQISNALLRQAGMDVPDAAIARTEYISRIDNEILPLLRQTFGAQFTEREGTSLKATLGDPNKSPQEKDAVLRSFIQTKMETANSLARQTGRQEPYQAKDIADSVESIGTKPQGNALEIDFKLRKAGFTPEQIKEYKAAKGL